MATSSAKPAIHSFCSLPTLVRAQEVPVRVNLNIDIYQLHERHDAIQNHESPTAGRAAYSQAHTMKKTPALHPFITMNITANQEGTYLQCMLLCKFLWLDASYPA